MSINFRKAYIYFASAIDKKNYLVGTITKDFIAPHTIYVITYVDDIDSIYDNVLDFRRIPGCHLEKKRTFIYKDRLPHFIMSRVPNPRRPDLPELLAKVGLKEYFVWEYMIRSHGVNANDRFYVSESPNATDFHDRWLHDISLKYSVKD